MRIKAFLSLWYDAWYGDGDGYGDGYGYGYGIGDGDGYGIGGDNLEKAGATLITV